MLKLALFSLFFICQKALGTAFPLYYDHFYDVSSNYDKNILSNRKSFELQNENLDFSNQNEVLSKELKELKNELRKIKYLMVNGQVNLASLFLDKITFSNSHLKPVIYRYLGTLFFIEEEFERSLQILNSPNLLESPHFSKICFLKTLNKIILNEMNFIDKEWKRCRIENYGKISNLHASWIDLIIELKTQKKFGITRTPFKDLKLTTLKNDELKSFLKFALYLNQERHVLEELQNLRFDQLLDTEVRELVGHIYFRLGLFSKSFPFIEDLNTPNSESIKGNLYILQEKYELAYAQFKLAYQIKNNSMNALERLSPLAWMLNDWEKGAEYSDQIKTTPEKYFHRLTLVSAFLIQGGLLDRAFENLSLISEKSIMANEIQITQMKSFLGIMKNDQKLIKEYSAQNCEKLDHVNCWLQNQFSNWENIYYLVRKEGDIKHDQSWKSLLSEDINTPLEEKVYIDQGDIEELDEKEEIQQLVNKKFKSEA